MPSAPPGENGNNSPLITPPVVAALRAGRKIEAIRILRMESGLGLREAKREVESWSRQVVSELTQQNQYPQGSAAKKQWSGSP